MNSNRRQFLQALSLISGAAVLAPEILVSAARAAEPSKDGAAAAKAAKDFALADTLRGQAEAQGWEIRDTPEGPQIKRKAAAI